MLPTIFPSLLIVVTHPDALLTAISEAPVISCNRNLSVATCTICEILKPYDGDSLRYFAQLANGENVTEFEVHPRGSLIPINDINPSEQYTITFMVNGTNFLSKWSAPESIKGADESLQCTQEHTICSCGTWTSTTSVPRELNTTESNSIEILPLETPEVSCNSVLSVATCTVCKIRNFDPLSEYKVIWHTTSAHSEVTRDTEFGKKDNPYITFNKLTPSQQYWLQVRASRNGMSSMWSNVEMFVAANESTTCTKEHWPCKCSSQANNDADFFNPELVDFHFVNSLSSEPVLASTLVVVSGLLTLLLFK